MAYTKIFTTPERESVYRQWIRINRGGTLRQFRIYLKYYEDLL